MIFVTGPLFAGKREWVRRALGLSGEELTARAVWDVQELAARCEDLPALARELEQKEIVIATEAAYDAGARTIIAWGYYGSESNDYAAKNPEKTWVKTCEAFRRVREMERDAILGENRKRHGR